MLTRLSIRNFLLVEEAELAFKPGFTAITGETGAGKSMILGALRVLFGDALNEQLIRDGADRVVLEAEFLLTSAELLDLLGEDYCDDPTPVLTIRRELSRGGRSRGFVQDRPATLDLLRSVGERVMDFHGQRDSLSLFRPSRQLEFLDAFANAGELRDRVALAYRKRTDLLHARDALLNDVRLRRKEQALLAYQLEEIERLGLRDGEDIDIAARLKKLEQSEKLITLAGQIAGLLEQNDVCAVSLVGQANKLADEVRKIDGDFTPFAAELAELASRLRDLGNQVSHYADRADVDAEELESLRQRAATLSELRRKHGVDLAQILEQARRMKDTLAELAELEKQLAGVDKDLALADGELIACAAKLSALRGKAAPQFATATTAALKPLGFNKPGFELKLEATGLNVPERIGRTGADTVQFVFSAASGQALAPLSDVASGGESSRVTLAIKSVVAERMHYPLLVYDEIDLGISGRVASAVATLLHNLGHAQQIIVVTHLPQIAARAEHHLLVSKLTQGRRTLTTAVMLKPDQRAKAVAELLAGETVSGSALAAADELLNPKKSSTE
ncbi:MAG: DNA repair protein RecN [bacterium]|nr:DNA repair protein RecN [bacterium]